MSLIAPRQTSGRWIVVPESYDRLARSSFERGQRRRKRLLIGLLVGAGASLFAAIFAGGGMWELHLAVDASLALYVVLLREAKRRREEHSSKVRSLAVRRLAEEVKFHEPARAGGGRT